MKGESGRKAGFHPNERVVHFRKEGAYVKYHLKRSDLSQV